MQFFIQKAHMCSHQADLKSADFLLKTCVNAGYSQVYRALNRRDDTDRWVLRGMRRRSAFRCVLTISTDVLTTSETLCLSSAAVPGLPRPRVNLLVSGCVGVAIVAHHFASMTAQSTRYIIYKLEESHHRFIRFPDPC